MFELALKSPIIKLVIIFHEAMLVNLSALIFILRQKKKNNTRF